MVAPTEFEIKQPRYAIYYAPDPRLSFWRFGSAVIGYDAHSGANVPLLCLHSDDQTWRRLTAEPRRYGFHATLKAPFQLREGKSELDLSAAVESFAATYAPVGPINLQVRLLGSFAALVPTGNVGLLNALAASIVETFEPFRAELSARDRARRLAAPLSTRQRTYLDRFGYPHVHEEFRFHMTLTGPLPHHLRECIVDALGWAYDRHVGSAPVEINALSVLRQDRRDENFRIIGRYPMAGLQRL